MKGLHSNVRELDRLVSDDLSIIIQAREVESQREARDLLGQRLRRLHEQRDVLD